MKKIIKFKRDDYYIEFDEQTVKQITDKFMKTKEETTPDHFKFKISINDDIIVELELCKFEFEIARLGDNSNLNLNHYILKSVCNRILQDIKRLEQ